ncbi:MAG TPA: alpha/beta hydrolase [Chloroflexota bacterium]|nr:alpha/beta hydrolase [Chloroflexota bacterium]
MSASVEHGWVVVPAVRSVLETAYGVRTHYLHAGQGEPVVLVHGGGPGASASAFNEVIPPLAERFSVFALDQIGNGDSDKPLIEYSPLTLVDHLAGFIDVLDLEGVRLVGHSRGAYTVMRYALDFPRRVKQVAFSSAASVPKAMGLELAEKATPLPPYDGSRESVRVFLELMLNDPNIPPEVVDRRLAAARQPGHQEFLTSNRRYEPDPTYRQAIDIGSRVAHLTAPCCIIWGEQDGRAPLATVGQAMREAMPNAAFHVVPGSPHSIPNAKPAEYARLLLDFFGS